MNKYFISPFLLLSSVLFMCACAVPSAKHTPTANRYAAAKGENYPAQMQTDTIDLRPSVTQEENPLQEPQPIEKESKEPIVRVLLADKQKKTTIKHSGRVYVYTKDLSKRYKVSSAGTLAIKALGGGKIQIGMLQTTQPILLEPSKNTLLTWNNNSYSGTIYILPSADSFDLVEYAPLETYLYGVLPYEMSYSWPIEALKAQAVAARTYTLKTLENVKNKTFDVYSDVRSQMYKGGGKQYDSVRTAVDETRGQVLTYKDKLFFTYYHANCGGGTDDVKSWSPSSTSIKPLAGASCKYDTHSKSRSWKMTVPTSKVQAYAKKAGLSGKLKSIKIVRKTNTGRATNLTIKTSKGSKTVPCGNFRLATGIRSCKITKLSVSSKGVYFEGKGYGHGVGMCQDGAHGMAKAEKTYKQILKNYYPDAKITEIK